MMASDVVTKLTRIDASLQLEHLAGLIQLPCDFVVSNRLGARFVCKLYTRPEHGQEIVSLSPGQRFAVDVFDRVEDSKGRVRVVGRLADELWCNVVVNYNKDGVLRDHAFWYAWPEAKCSS